MKYQQQYDGEWFSPKRKNWYMRCCDCGLVHRVNFRIRKGVIQMQATRLRKRKSLISLKDLEKFSSTEDKKGEE
jgi:hypothetical protein